MAKKIVRHTVFSGESLKTLNIEKWVDTVLYRTVHTDRNGNRHILEIKDGSEFKIEQKVRYHD